MINRYAKLFDRDIITAVREQLRDYLKSRHDGVDPDEVPPPPASSMFPYRDELIEVMRANSAVNPRIGNKPCSAMGRSSGTRHVL